MMRVLSIGPRQPEPERALGVCEYRTVSPDGRVICTKVAEGENAVSPEVCHTCPVRAANCTHLRFTLRQRSPSPLTVRFNGRTEIWDDGPAEVRLAEAACAARIAPIGHPDACRGCTLRLPVDGPAIQPDPRVRRPAGKGKVVPFPLPSPVPAGG
jgi:hypothetical protein